MASITMTRDELLARLDEQLHVAKKWDEHRLAAHRKAEQEFLLAFRRSLREALKWDYTTAKKAGFTARPEHRYGPDCPRSVAADVDRAIRQVRPTSRARWVLIENSPSTGNLYWCVTFSPDAIAPGTC